jgi:predicted DNA-binding transcriptional regulator AlpA
MLKRTSRTLPGTSLDGTDRTRRILKPPVFILHLLCISPDTWDRMVDRKELPPAVIVSGMPRWKWEAVEAWLSGKRDCVKMPENPYLAALANGKTQKHRNDRAT